MDSAVKPDTLQNEAPVQGTRTSWLGNRSVNQKLLLIPLLIGIPVVITSGFLTSDLLSILNRNVQKSRVAEIYGPLQFMQQSTRTIQGTPLEDITPEMMSNFQKSSQQVVDTLKTTNIPIVQQIADDISTKSKQMIEGFNAKSISFKDFDAGATALLTKDVNPLFALLASQGGLLAYNNMQTNDLASLSSQTLPTLLPAVGREFDGLLSIATTATTSQNGKLTASQRLDAQQRLASARNQLDQLEQQVKVILDSNPSIAAAVQAPLADAIAKSRLAFQQTENDLLKPPVITKTVAEINKNSDLYLGPQYKAFSAVVEAMNKNFSAETSSARTRLYTLLASLALLTLLLFWLIRTILRGITTPLSQLTLASQRLAQGELDARVPVTTNDELGRLASSFNFASAQLAENAQRVEMERREQEALQRNIGDFLDVTMDIAEGDLTKRGRVTEDVMGNVVDSINLMTEELGSVLKDVQTASHSVASGSESMIASTQRMTQGTEQVIEEANRVSQQMQLMTEDIRRMARNAQESADTARLALQASQQGQAAVTDTLEGMQNIRREVLGIAKRMKTLGDRSLEIQEIVDSISQLTRQTNLLALNASVEAAGAGEAGGRFAIVADEVRKLADTSRDSATRIATLIRNIQVDIQDMIINVEESSAEVEQGYRVAGTAGERLREIGDLTEQSAVLAERISAATTEQVRGVEQMGQAVQQITEISGQAGQAVREGEAVAEQLRQLSLQLDNSLNRFRLPS